MTEPTPISRRSRGQLPPLPTVEDPAVSSAMAKCVVNRLVPPRIKNQDTGRLEFVISEQHPRDCRYEGYPVDQLIERIAEFNDKSGLTAHDRWSKGRPNISVEYRPESYDYVVYTPNPEPVEEPRISARLTLFMDAGPAIQAELVLKAQGYVEG